MKPLSYSEEITILITEGVLEQARNDLEGRAAALNDCQFSDVIRQDFSFAEIRAGIGGGAISAWIRPLLGQEIHAAAIYRLTVNNQAGADRMRQAFIGYEPENGHALTRNNNVTDSTTVYVGSSQSIGQRLQQHLHTCAKGTYALKMHLWCPDADNRIIIEVSLVAGDVETSVVQDIEDTLWKMSRPMFGKLGAK